MEKQHRLILPEILFKNLEKVGCPRLGTEPALKMLKLC